MPRLTLLGPIDLRGSDGREVLTILAQPKRTALLAYLTLASARGFQRRDAVASLFWPDLDESRARHALNKSVHFLRQALGKGVLIGRGDGDVSIDATHLSCDAIDFHDAISAGRWEDGIELARRGQLLHGVTFFDNAELERWLDGERDRIRRGCIRATEALIERATDSGDGGAVLRWATLAFDFDPHSELAIRTLMTAQDASGNRAGALDAFEGFAARVRKDLDTDPSPETLELAQRIRERAEAVASVHPLPAYAGASSTDMETEAPSARPADRQTPALSRVQAIGSAPASRFGTWAAAALAVLVALMGVAWLTARGPSEPRLDRGRVLVAAFENRTGIAELDPLGEMAADWVARGVQRNRLAEVVDPLSALVMTRDTVAPELNGWARAAALAQESDAATVIWGSYYRHGDSIYFEATVSDRIEGEVLLALDPVSSSVASPIDALRDLRSRVTGALAASADARVTSQVHVEQTLPTFEAYREFIRGLSLFMQGSRQSVLESEAHFLASYRSDSAFHLGLVWAIFAAQTRVARRDSLIDELARHAPLPDELDQLALEYHLAYRANDPEAASRAAEAAARLAPGSTWSHNAANLAMGQNRLQDALRFESQIDAKRGWARGFSGYWSNLSRIHHLLGNHEEELALAARHEAVHGATAAGAVLRLRALAAMGRTAEMEPLILRILAPPYLDADRSAIYPWEALDGTWRELRVHGHEADPRLLERELEWLDSPQAAEWVSSRSDRLLGGYQLQAARIEALTDAGRLDRAVATGRELLSALQGGPRIPFFPGSIGIAAAAQGDREGADVAMRALEELGASRASLALARAEIEARLGNADEAIRELRSAASAADLTANAGTGRLFAIHLLPGLLPLHDLPGFRELVRLR